MQTASLGTRQELPYPSLALSLPALSFFDRSSADFSTSSCSVFSRYTLKIHGASGFAFSSFVADDQSCNCNDIIDNKTTI